MSLNSGYGPTVSCGISTQLPGVVVAAVDVLVDDVVVVPVVVVPPESLPVLQPSSVRPLKPPMPPSSERRENARAARCRLTHWSSDGRVAINRSMIRRPSTSLKRRAAAARPAPALRRLRENLELRHLLLGEHVLQLAEQLFAVRLAARRTAVARRLLSRRRAVALLACRALRFALREHRLALLFEHAADFAFL